MIKKYITILLNGFKYKDITVVCNNYYKADYEFNMFVNFLIDNTDPSISVHGFSGAKKVKIDDEITIRFVPNDFKKIVGRKHLIYI